MLKDEIEKKMSIKKDKKKSSQLAKHVIRVMRPS
jgi:hypothetical protein